MKALTTVVTMRSNSPMRGAISQERLTGRFGATSRAISRTRRSCAGLRNDQSRHTARLSAPAATSAAIASRASASFSATSTVPSAMTRSVTPRTMVLGTSGGGGSVCRKSIAFDCGRPPARPTGPRAMISVSSKPVVVMSPTRAPRRWISALVETVVPCAKRSVSASSVPTSMPVDCRERRERIQDALFGRLRCRERLVEAQASLAVDLDQVGEGAAGVDAEDAALGHQALAVGSVCERVPQVASVPPSTRRSMPVMNEASSETRNSTALA